MQQITITHVCGHKQDHGIYLEAKDAGVTVAEWRDMPRDKCQPIDPDGYCDMDIPADEVVLLWGW